MTPATAQHDSIERDSTQRRWEDVRDGEELPGFELQLTWTKMVEQVSGSQDFYPVHHDPDFAAEAGHPGIFYNTGFTRAALCRLLTDWIGPRGSLRRLRFEMRRMHRAGDTIRVRGRVTALRDVAADRGEVDVELWIENAREGIGTPATATVELPRRAPGVPR